MTAGALLAAATAAMLTFSSTPLPPVGTAIENAKSAHELLSAAVRVPPPGPEFAAPHLAQPFSASRGFDPRRRHYLFATRLQTLLEAVAS